MLVQYKIMPYVLDSSSITVVEAKNVVNFRCMYK